MPYQMLFSENLCQYGISKKTIERGLVSVIMYQSQEGFRVSWNIGIHSTIKTRISIFSPSILIGQTEFGESGVQGRGSDMPDRTTEGRYESKTVAELKELLRERSLPVSGNKAGLTARLEEADAADDYRPEHVRREPEVKVVPESQNEAIVAEVFDRLLGEGEKRHMTVILHTLASVLLGLEYSESTKGSLPKNWRDELDRALGVEGKASYWVHDLSPRELDFSEDRSTVWYAYGVIL